MRFRVGPITFFPGSLRGLGVTGCQLFGPSSAEEEKEERGWEKEGKNIKEEEKN